MRKDLCAEGMIRTIYQKFSQIKKNGQNSRSTKITVQDCLMACFAVFSLKWPSLLQYEEAKSIPNVLKNLQALYIVNNPPSDTYMRECLDEIHPDELRVAFKKIFALAQRGKVLEQYEFLDGYYLFCSDGTGFFSSNKIHCKNCCVKNHYDGSVKYYHNMMGGAIVHPQRKEVIPFCPELIQKQDGMKKNDCEQNASKRQLEHLRREHPHIKIIVTQDALSDCGPNISLLESLGMKYIIVCKRNSFDWMDPSKVFCWEHKDSSGLVHKYRFINDIPLNGIYPNIRTNFFEETTVVSGKEKKGSWITNIPITEKNVHLLMLGGRARWKIENETFNTLKNQGYHLEHNFGHGNKNLCNVMVILMMLAFLVDQLQLICCRFYQEAKRAVRVFSSLWEKMRTFFCYLELKSWEQFLGLISRRLSLNTS